MQKPRGLSVAGLLKRVWLVPAQFFLAFSFSALHLASAALRGLP